MLQEDDSFVETPQRLSPDDTRVRLRGYARKSW